VRAAEHGEDAAVALEDRSRTCEACACKQRGLDTRSARRTAMQALHLAACAVVFHGASCIAGRDPERVCELGSVEAEQTSGRGGGSEHPQHLRAVPARGEHAPPGDRPKQAHDLNPRHHRGENIAATRALSLSEGQHRWNDGGPGVPGGHVGIVELCAMAEGSVHPSSLRRADAATEDYRGLGRASERPRHRSHRLHVCQTRAAHLHADVVEHEQRRVVHHLDRQVLEAQAHHPRGKPLRHRRRG
jgi:hypothetical protein